jgi:hypothetical protein
MALHHSPRIVTSGLVLALDAGDVNSYPGSGTAWKDLSGNGNHFTLYGAPTLNSAGYFVFDGTNDYSRSTSTLNLSSYTAVTVLIWFKPTSYPSSGTLDFVYELTSNFNSYTGGFVHSYNDTSLSQDYQVFLSNKGSAGYNIGVWNKSLFNDLAWKYSAGVFDRNQSSAENSLYVNGTVATALSNPYPGYANDNTNTFANDYFFIGTRGGVTYFSDMSVAGIQVYNRALSATEIEQNYLAQKSRFGL